VSGPTKAAVGKEGSEGRKDGWMMDDGRQEAEKARKGQFKRAGVL
jgi:hypothetical protein